MYPEQFLLANKWKKLGWILFIPGFIGAIMMLFFTLPFELNLNVYSIFNEDAENGFSMFIKNDFRDEIIAMLLSIGGILIAFSAEKEENELVQSIRLNAFKWAFLFGLIIIAVTTPFIFEFAYLHVMIFNLYIPLIIYILKFNLTLYKVKKQYHETENA